MEISTGSDYERIKLILEPLLALLIALTFSPKETQASERIHIEEISVHTISEADDLSKEELKLYAKELSAVLWGEGSFKYFDRVISKESAHWSVHTAHYPVSGTSTAHGLGGFLDATWETVGCVKTDNPIVQIGCTARYITQRYDTPQKAWEHHLAFSWY